MNLFTKLFRSRDKPKNYLSGRLSFLFGQTSAGRAVNEQTAMQVTAVYACVRILAEAIAGLPLCVYRYTEDGSKEKVLDHPLYALLHEIIVRACTLLTENINIILKIFQYQQENPLQERNTY